MDGSDREEYKMVGTSLRVEIPLPSLRYLDTTGDGMPDAFVAVEVAEVGRSDDHGRIVRRVIETRATGIDLDGVPGHIHITERVLAASESGDAEEVTVHDLEIEPESAERARTLIEAATSHTALSSPLR